VGYRHGRLCCATPSTTSNQLEQGKAKVPANEQVHVVRPAKSSGPAAGVATDDALESKPPQVLGGVPFHARMKMNGTIAWKSRIGNSATVSRAWRRAQPASRQRQPGKGAPGTCTTCWETSSNGWKTGIPSDTTNRGSDRTRMGRPPASPMRNVRCGAGRGTAFRAGFLCQSGTGSSQMSVTVLSGSDVLRDQHRRGENPLQGGGRVGRQQ
jgi:hypothetical protein